MSKLCIAVFKDTSNGSMLKNEINFLIRHFNLGVHFDLLYQEPFLLQMYDKNNILCNFVDSYFSDNCEMLLLPDKCTFNGEENILPFKERMKEIEAILKVILNHTENVDFFVGDSGTTMNEFESYTIHIHEFLQKTDSLNSIYPPDLHFTIIQ